MMSSPGLNPGLPQIRILPAVFRLGNPRECNVASSVNMTPTATQPRHDILTVLSVKDDGKCPSKEDAFTLPFKIHFGSYNISHLTTSILLPLLLKA
jgi:hypothetical protein